MNEMTRRMLRIEEERQVCKDFISLLRLTYFMEPFETPLEYSSKLALVVDLFRFSNFCL